MRLRAFLIGLSIVGIPFGALIWFLIATGQITFIGAWAS